MERSLCWTCTLQGIAMTTDSSLRTPAAEILPVPKMRKGARQSACMPEREIALLDPYPSGHRDDHRFVIANRSAIKRQNNQVWILGRTVRQSACMPEQESALQDLYPSGHRDDHRFVIAMER